MLWGFDIQSRKILSPKSLQAWPRYSNRKMFPGHQPRRLSLPETQPVAIPVREKQALQALQRYNHGQIFPGHQPGRLSRQETQPSAVHIPSKPTPGTTERPGGETYEAPKPAPSRQERPATAAHTTPAARPSKCTAYSLSSRLEQNHCRANVLGGGKLSVGQTYETAVAKL